MTIARAEGDESLALDESPAEELPPDATDTGLLHHLKAAWTAYLAENERDWEKLVEEQARNPTLG